jgi:hypothetical protein
MKFLALFLLIASAGCSHVATRDLYDVHVGDQLTLRYDAFAGCTVYVAEVNDENVCGSRSCNSSKAYPSLDGGCYKYEELNVSRTHRDLPRGRSER